MASNTPNINLYKKDVATDGNDTFNITTMLNDNWDKIDTKFGQQDKDFIRQPAFLSATSTNNVYTATSTPEPMAYADGMGIILKADKDSTGAITLNWNALGAKALKDAQGNNISLKANGIYTFKYNADMGYFMLQGSNVYANGQVQTNLNADMLDGKNASDFAPSGYGLGQLLKNTPIMDANNATATGMYYLSATGSNLPQGIIDCSLLVMSYDTTWVTQLARDWRTNKTFTRVCTDGTWSVWQEISTNNYTITTNSGNTYSATIGGLSSLTDGLQVRVKFNSASSGATTLNINSLGAKSIVDYFGNAVTNIRQNLIANLCYEATSGNFILQGKGGGGNATSADLLSGKTATVDSGQITGSMPNNAWGLVTNKSLVWNDSGNTKLAIKIPVGAYLEAKDSNNPTSSEVDIIENNLVSANIKAGSSIFGVSGKSSVVDTADATALTADKILNGYSAYANGSKVNGNATLQSLGGKRYFETSINVPGYSFIYLSAPFHPTLIKVVGGNNMIAVIRSIWGDGSYHFESINDFGTNVIIDGNPIDNTDGTTTFRLNNNIGGTTTFKCMYWE